LFAPTRGNRIYKNLVEERGKLRYLNGSFPLAKPPICNNSYYYFRWTPPK